MREKLALAFTCEALARTYELQTIADAEATQKNTSVVSLSHTNRCNRQRNTS